MKEIKEKYSKEIYLNILKAIIIVLYFLVLNLAYENISAEHIELGIKIFTMVFLFISIYIFEKAYKKDDDKLAIQGIEILILSAYTLTSRHITNKFNFIMGKKYNWNFWFQENCYGVMYGPTCPDCVNEDNVEAWRRYVSSKITKCN